MVARLQKTFRTNTSKDENYCLSLVWELRTKGVLSYVKEHYKKAKFGDVGKVLDAQGKTSYEVEINGKDVIFDENGNFVKSEK